MLKMGSSFVLAIGVLMNSSKRALTSKEVIMCHFLSIL